MSTRVEQEPLLSIWARRLVSIPLYTALACLLFGLAPLFLLPLGLVDLLAGDRHRWPRLRTLMFFGVYLGSEVVTVMLAGLLWLRCLGHPERVVPDHMALQHWWGSVLFGGACRVFGMTLVVEHGEAAAEGPFLLLVRHSSTADTVLADVTVAAPHRIVPRYIVKRELAWDPGLDVIGRRLPNAFLDRAAGSVGADIAAMVGLAQGLGPRDAVLLYPEGTRFSPQKLARAIEKLREHGHADLADFATGFRHVLPPKLGGALALLEAVPGIDVVFLEHTGFEGAASFAGFWRGAFLGQTIRVRLRRVKASEIPTEGRDRWLFEQWREVDRWIDQHIEGAS